MGRQLLSTDDVEAIRSAVARAEATSGAEIVPVVVESCDGYEIATWMGAALGALAGALAAAAWVLMAPPWGATAARALLPTALGALAGALLSHLPPLRRRLAGRIRLARRVEAAAGAAFIAHEVFRTRDRTGMLLFVSHFERKVTILADSGVHAAVPKEEWRALADGLAADMGRETPGRALLAAVERAGAVVAARGPVRRADDVNELPDAPIAGET
jgi:putative membrane protein